MALILVVLIPLVAAVLVALTGAWPNLREAISLLAGGILFFLVLSLLPSVLAGADTRLANCTSCRTFGYAFWSDGQFLVDGNDCLFNRLSQRPW